MHIDAWLRNVDTFNELLAKQQRSLGRTGTGYSSNPFLDKMMQAIETRMIAQEMKGLFGSEKTITQQDVARIVRDEIQRATPKEGFKDDLVKMMLTAFLKGGQGDSGTDMFLRGIQTASNLIPQQMGDEARIALKKLDIDVEKMKMDSDASTAKMNLVGNIANQVFTALPQVLGRKTQPTTENGTSTKCPSCNQPFLLPSPTPEKIQCPNPKCQAILTREAETPQEKGENVGKR